MDKLVAVRDRPSKVADASSDAASAVRRHSSRNRKQSLWLQVLGRPLSLAVLCTFGTAGLVAIVFAAVWVVPGLLDSAEQRSLHRAPIHADHTALKTHVVRSFPAPKTLVYRDRDGRVHRALVDQPDLDRFGNETFEYLETERAKIKAETHAKIGALLAMAFSDSQDCISRYADWYYEWGRSYFLLKEGAVGGLNGLGVNNVQGFVEGARNQVEAYLIRNYERIVLKPELRNPVIDAGVSQILAEAHQRYLQTLTTIDDRVQHFLSEYTQHLDVVDPLRKVDLSIDWDAQKWKAPRYSTDDEAFRAVFQGGKDILVSGLIARTAGPAIERALVQGFLGISGRAVAGLQPELYGVVAGSVVEPGAGTFAGWFVGAGAGLLFDYVSNRVSERLGRGELEQASNEALKATIGELSRAFQRDLSQAVDVWFDDTRAIVSEQKLGRK
jgi:hypothetical protein